MWLVFVWDKHASEDVRSRRDRLGQGRDTLSTAVIGKKFGWPELYESRSRESGMAGGA